MVRVSEGETGTETACWSGEEPASPPSSCSGDRVSSSADLSFLSPLGLFGFSVTIQRLVEALATPRLRRRTVLHGSAGEEDELGMSMERLGLCRDGNVERVRVAIFVALALKSERKKSLDLLSFVRFL